MESNNNNKTNGYSVRLVKESAADVLSASALYALLYKSYLQARKISLQPASKGFDFLGVHILPYRVYAGKRIIKNCRNSVLKNTVDVSEKIKSYRGIFKHLNGMPSFLR